MRTRDLFGLLTTGTTLIATASLVSMSSALSGDSCVPVPGQQTEPGTHWYYRVDRATNRHCWYLKRLEGQASTPEPAVSSPSDSKEMPQVLSKPEKAATPLPLDPAMRETLFRQFVEWRHKNLVEAQIRDFLHQPEEKASAR